MHCISSLYSLSYARPTSKTQRGTALGDAGQSASVQRWNIAVGPTLALRRPNVGQLLSSQRWPYVGLTSDNCCRCDVVQTLARRRKNRRWLDVGKTSALLREKSDRAARVPCAKKEWARRRVSLVAQPSGSWRPDVGPTILCCLGRYMTREGGGGGGGGGVLYTRLSYMRVFTVRIVDGRL